MSWRRLRSGLLVPATGADVAVITGMKTWGHSGSGYSNNTGRTITLTLKASDTDPTTNSWVGTTIGSIAPFANAWAATPKETLGNANTTRYRYVWLEHQISAADVPFVAEVEFYETLAASETKIDTTGLPVKLSNYGSSANALDGNLGTQITGSSGSIFRIGVDLGAL